MLASCESDIAVPALSMITHIFVCREFCGGSMLLEGEMIEARASAAQRRSCVCSMLWAWRPTTIRRLIDNSNLPEDWAKVGVVGAAEL